MLFFFKLKPLTQGRLLLKRHYTSKLRNQLYSQHWTLFPLSMLQSLVIFSPSASTGGQLNLVAVNVSFPLFSLCPSLSVPQSLTLVLFLSSLVSVAFLHSLYLVIEFSVCFPCFPVPGLCLFPVSL